MLTRLSEALVERKLKLGAGLGFTESEWQGIAARWPRLLLRTEFAAWVKEARRQVGLDAGEVRRLLMARGDIVTVRPDRIGANFRRNVASLGVDESTWKRAALSFSPLLYLRPEHVEQAVVLKAQVLGVSRASVIEAVLKVPSLVSRDAKKLKRRAKLIGRIAALRGDMVTPGAVLKQWPHALTYGEKRLLARYFIAKHGLSERNWSSLLQLSGAKAAVLIKTYLENCEPGRRKRLHDHLMKHGALGV